MICAIALSILWGEQEHNKVACLSMLVNSWSGNESSISKKWLSNKIGNRVRDTKFLFNNVLR